MATNETAICVIGDSFAGNRNNAEWNKTFKGWNKDWSWVNLLESNNTGKLYGRSFPGQSFHHQRRWFSYNILNGHWKSELPAPDHAETVLIFVHTNHYRLPHVRDVPVTGQVLVADKNDSNSNELFHQDPTGYQFDFARTFYLSQFFVEEFYFSAYVDWLSTLPVITRRFKKVIHLFGFETKLNNLPNFDSSFYVGKLLTPNSVVVADSLCSISLAERGNRQWGGPDIGDDRQNHFNKHNNIQLYKQLTDIINNVPGGTYHHLDLSDWELKDRSLLEKIALHRSNFDPTDPINNKWI